MNFPVASSPESEGATTSLWRTKQGYVQFTPNERAVVDLLKFLGFSKVEKLKPNQKGLEKRYIHWTSSNIPGNSLVVHDN